MKTTSIIWIITYVLIIIIFAVIYNNLPYEFYHTTYKFERYLQEDNDKIREEIQEFFKQTLIEAHGKQIIKKGSILFDINTIEITQLVVEDGEVKFFLSGWFLDKDFMKRMQTSKWFEFYLYPFKNNPDTLNNNILVYERFIEAADNDDFRNFTLKVFDLFVTDNLNISKGKNSSIAGGNYEYGRFYITDKIQSDLFAYSSSLQGFPSFSSGNFERMLYLSAVTITTLGTGDILPITTRARLLVTFEAILGVIIIGLYLNSIAQNALKK